MTCYRPLSAWQTEAGDIVFVERGRIRRPLSLPCGQCIGCRVERSRQWATRCVHESQLHEHSSFVTLTYSDEHAPWDCSLDYRHFQLFMKRLRKKMGPVRFYMCGEYGPVHLRPHYHACLFGCFFADREAWSRGADGLQLYRSSVLDDLWPYGFASVGDVTFQSAAYVARYVLKKVTGSRAAAHYERVHEQTGEVTAAVPEFTRMSLKPGIGFDWIRLYHPEVLANGGCIVDGRRVSIPRFYSEYLKSTDEYQALELARYEAVVPYLAHSTPARLAVREAVAEASFRVYSRDLE